MNENVLYSKQLIIKSFEKEKQKILKYSKVLIIGAGGLGHPVATYLTSAGVGTIGICDHDIINLSNLNRQFHFDYNQVNQCKVDVLIKKLKLKNPFIKFFSYNIKIKNHNVFELINKYDLIVDCTDNIQTKLLIHDACFTKNKNLIQGSVYQYEGQVHVFKYNTLKKNGCLRCLWGEEFKTSIPSCEEVGVLGASVGILGSIQAMETIKVLTGITSLKENTTFTMNFLTMKCMHLKWKKLDNCFLCSNNIKKSKYTFSQINNFDNEVDFVKQNSIVIDIRNAEERDNNEFEKKILNIPIEAWDYTVNFNKDVVLVCSKGIKSKSFADSLNSKGFENVYSLKGGIKNYFKSLSK
jgi:sulfur-carrier protein adenylyltransferase/sulfurtransferase